MVMPCGKLQLFSRNPLDRVHGFNVRPLTLLRSCQYPKCSAEQT
jgi:hypothetical protein